MHAEEKSFNTITLNEAVEIILICIERTVN